MSRIIFVVLTVSFLFQVSWGHSQTYLDSTAAIPDRVEDLLGRMTLAEKIGQMTQADRRFLQSESDIATYGLGSVLSGGGSAPAPNTPQSWADMYDRFQSHALSTRLKIPLIYGIDAVHGHNNVKGAVIFPHNIGLGCTRNDSLVQKAARVTAIEVAGTGIDWTFAPCIAVPQDERWGRTYEGFGETPDLTSQMAAAAVRGLQGDDLAEGRTILACAKHFVGDGGTTNGIDQGDTEVDEQTLRAIHLPGYISAISAGVGSIMASFNIWNGEKVHGSRYLLTTVLKQELGFAGFVVSDWAGIDQLPGPYASDVETAINAGIDMVMVPDRYANFINTLNNLVQQGKVSQTRIDDAVRRNLRLKFELGLFERPFTNRSLTGLIGSRQHREVARACVRESLVLLKKKDATLPISKSGQRIYVSGKNADNLGYQCGGWTISWQGSSGDITTGTTILQAIRIAVSSTSVTYAVDGSGGEGADVGIAVIGEKPYAEGRGDRTDLNLSEEDIAAVRNLKNAGLKVITIIVSGRPLVIEPILHYCDAIIAAWLPGTEGQGVADVLFGDYAPSGQLSHSWPKSMPQIPINFGDDNYEPLFEYNYGITSFADSEPGSPPVFMSAATTGDGAALEVAFNKVMSGPPSSASDFVVDVNFGGSNPVTGVLRKEIDPTTLVVALNEPIVAGDVVTVAYTAGDITSADGGKLAPFAAQPVYNVLNETGTVFAVPGKVEAEAYAAMFGVQTETTLDVGGGLNVGWIDSGDWMDYRVNILSSDVYKLDYRVASQSVAGQIELQKDGAAITTTNLPVTGGWQTWRTVSSFVHLDCGVQTLRVYANAGGFNLNWLEFSFLTSVEQDPTVPEQFALFQNYPNPFNSETRIRFELPVASFVNLRIYNTLGQQVRTLVERHFPAGVHTVKWDARGVQSGMYVYKLGAGAFSETKQLIVQK